MYCSYGQTPSPYVDLSYTVLMIYDGEYYNQGRTRPKFPDICFTVEGKPQKKLNQEIDPIGIEPGPTTMMLPLTTEVVPK